MKWLRRCRAGGHYTMMEYCHGQPTASPHPPKFDPKDRRAEYRRKAKGIE